ncbi:MAG: thiamine phosphate synthase [Muribaculaceae bacterium]
MLQFITNATDKYSIEQEVEMVLNGGCKWIQLRMKDAIKESVMDMARIIQPKCKERDCIFVVDDWVEIAKELNLDGVHLGKMDMSLSEARELLGQQYIIGATANNIDDIIDLSKKDIDYIGLGPYRFTSTKKKLSSIIGLDGYADIMAKCAEHDITIPMVAIGGIEYDDIVPIMDTGISGIAVSGGIINASNPTMMTTRIIDTLKSIIEKRNTK